jgi:hypothetical protein
MGLQVKFSIDISEPGSPQIGGATPSSQSSTLTGLPANHPDCQGMGKQGRPPQRRVPRSAVQ